MLTILFLSLWAVSSAQGKSIARMISFLVLSYLSCGFLNYLYWLELNGRSFTTGLAACNDFFSVKITVFLEISKAREKLKYWITDPLVKDIHFRRLSTLRFSKVAFSHFITFAIIITKGLSKISV